MLVVGYSTFVEYLRGDDFDVYREAAHDITVQFQTLASTAKSLRDGLRSAEADEDIIELCHEMEVKQQRKLQLVGHYLKPLHLSFVLLRLNCKCRQHGLRRLADVQVVADQLARREAFRTGNGDATTNPAGAPPSGVYRDFPKPAARLVNTDPCSACFVLSSVVL